MITRWILLVIAVIFSAPLQAAINSCSNLNNTQWIGSLTPSHNSFSPKTVIISLNTANSATSSAVLQNVTGQINVCGQKLNLLSNSTCTNNNNSVSLQLNAVNNQGTTMWITTGPMTVPFSIINVPFNGANFTCLNNGVVTASTTDYYSGSLLQQN